MKKILLILSLILVGVIPLFASTKVLAQNSEKRKILISISNISSRSFAVSWVSDQKNHDAIMYGTNPNQLDKYAVDDRGGATDRITHHVTIMDILPETDVVFKIENDNQIYHQKTAPYLYTIPRTGDKFGGKITTEDGTIPNEGMIYTTIGDSQLITTPIYGNTGTWDINSFAIRNSSLTEYYWYPLSSMAVFYAISGSEGEGGVSSYVFAKDRSLDINLAAPRVTFFKVQLPGSEKYLAQPLPSASDTPSTQSNPQASNEGFFDVIWRRLKEIF